MALIFCEPLLDNTKEKNPFCGDWGTVWGLGNSVGSRAGARHRHHLGKSVIMREG